MLLGCIYKVNDTSKPHKELQQILKGILWEDANITTYVHGSFTGIFLCDKRLPVKKPGEVFFYDPDKGILVFVDGYLYNKEETISDIGTSKETPETAELIYLAYQKWDIAFAEKLNGDFSICIHCQFSHRTLFFRDHLGIRPLSVSQTESCLYFATDPMGLCKALFSGEKIEKEYLINFLLSNVRNYTLLPYKNIFNVKPGHYVDFNRKSWEQKPYWHPDKIKTDKKLTQTDVIDDLNKLIFNAVAIRSDIRFIASAHVSGGLDSGIVSILARKNYSHQPDFFGFSWSPDIKTSADKIILDERILVEKICAQNNIKPKYSNINVDDYLSFLANWRYPSEFIFEKITLEKAKKEGINLIFSGWGGDEFISIGNYGIDSDLLKNNEWRYFFEKNSPQNLKHLLSILYHKAFLPAIKFSKTKIKTEEYIYPYIKDALKINKIKGSKKIKIKSRRDFHLYFLERNRISARTADWYVHGQRNGIEYRYPLLDKRIVEYMLKVPSRCLVKDQKNRIILREIGKGLLPAEVLLNTIKDDPVGTFRYNLIIRSLLETFKIEYLDFKNNPDLNFINFTLLDKRVEQERDHQEVLPEKDTFIYYYLKRIHEFTKGFYGD